MDTLTSKDARELMYQHLGVLREYAKRVVDQHDMLSPEEYDDKETRFREYAAIGDSFKLTEREMVRLLFKGLFPASPNCDCPTCRARNR